MLISTLKQTSIFIRFAGCVLLSADYRQFELRLLAHFSGDEGLLAAFGVDSEVVPLEPTTTSKTGKPPQSQQTKQTKQTKHGKGDGGAKTAGGVDVFRRLAARWCDKPLGLVTSYERNAVKQMCYAVLFGAGVCEYSLCLELWLFLCSIVVIFHYYWCIRKPYITNNKPSY